VVRLAQARSESGAEEMAAALQAQHQERLQKIVEAHNRDLTLLQVHPQHISLSLSFSICFFQY
jgi:hypothetical protein